jgi:hypothetical protein
VNLFAPSRSRRNAHVRSAEIFSIVALARIDEVCAMPSLPNAPTPGRYRHYKGNEYRVMGVARHTETEECVVVYQALYGERGWWVRPQAMFCESVVVEGKTLPRFAFVSAD